MATLPLDSFQAGMYTLRARTGLKMPRWNEFEVPKQQPRTRRRTPATASAKKDNDTLLDSNAGLTAVSVQHPTNLDHYQSIPEKGVYNSMEVDRIEDATVLIEQTNITQSRTPQSRGTRKPEPTNPEITTNLEMTMKTRSMAVKGDAAGESQVDVVVRRTSPRTNQDLAQRTNVGRLKKTKGPALKSNKIGIVKSPLRGAVKRKPTAAKIDNAKVAKSSTRLSKSSSKKMRSSNAKTPRRRRQSRNNQTIKDHTEVPYQTRSASKRKPTHFEETSSSAGGKTSSKRARSSFLKAQASNGLDVSDTESELSEAPSNVSSTVDLPSDEGARKKSYKSGKMKSFFISEPTQDGKPWIPKEEEFQLPEYIIEKYQTHKEAAVTNEGVAENNATHD